MKTKPNDQTCDQETPIREFSDTYVGESYQDIKNRAPAVIRTWRELMEGYLTRGGEEDSNGEESD